MVTDWLMIAYDFFINSFEGLYLKLVVTIIILFVGIIIGKIASKLVKKILSEIEIDNIVKKATGVTVGIEKMISSFVSYFIYFIAIIMALNQLNITTTVLSMISGAIILLIIISVTLAIKDFIPNLIAGFYIHRNRFIKKGEWISVKGMEGEVKEITMIETKIETANKDVIFIPNSALTKTEIIKIKKPSKRKSKRHE